MKDKAKYKLTLEGNKEEMLKMIQSFKDVLEISIENDLPLHHLYLGNKGTTLICEEK
jgi:hypothetical protein